MYCFTTSISRGVENYFPRLWGMGISDAIFIIFSYLIFHFLWNWFTSAAVFALLAGPLIFYLCADNSIVDE